METFSSAQPIVNNEDQSTIDPIWTTSRTARQIYALGEVEKVVLAPPLVVTKLLILKCLQDISRLLSLAASSISLLTLPQTDPVEGGLPQGEERSEQFVLEVGEFFERLDVSRVSRFQPAILLNNIGCPVCPVRHPIIPSPRQAL
jgi:hypothetical protein